MRISNQTTAFGKNSFGMDPTKKLLWVEYCEDCRKRTIASTCSYASFSAIIVSHDTESKKLST